MTNHITAVCPTVRRDEKIKASKGYSRTVKRMNRADNGQRVGGHDKRSPRQG